ncbi:DDB1- and CUL4-associated factor 17-like isoform X1 [Argonauta hians]
MLQLGTKHHNVYCLLRFREYKIHNGTLRKSLRTLCYRNTQEYHCTFEVHSNQPIFSVEDYILMKNCLTCYDCWGSKVWQDVHQNKLSDIIYCYGYLELNPSTNVCYNSSLIGISNKTYLVHICAKTGVVLNKLFLSNKLRFRTIEWEDPQRCFAISSTTVSQPSSTTTTTTTTNNNNNNKVLSKVIALFNVNPLKFVGMFAINTKIFGPKFEDGLVTDNLLIIKHRGGLVELYSMEFILKHYVLYEAQLAEPDPVTGLVVGLYPHGLPININIKDRPPLLLSVKSVDHDIQFGGFPFHMLLASGQRGVFYLRTLPENNLVEGGRLDLGNQRNIEDDTAVFHPDVHNKIILYGGSKIRILRLSSDGDDSKKCVKLQKEILLDQMYKRPAVNQVTRSGRRVTSSTYYECIVSHVIYDSELDIFAIITQEQNVCLSTNQNTQVTIYDNETCDQLGEIKVDLSTEEMIDSNFFLSSGTLIRISKGTANKFTCSVYKPVQSV